MRVDVFGQRDGQSDRTGSLRGERTCAGMRVVARRVIAALIRSLVVSEIARFPLSA